VAFKHENAISEILDAALGVDGSNTDSSNQSLVRIVGENRKALVRGIPRPSTPRNPYSRAYCAIGRGLFQKHDPYDGQAKRNEKVGLWNHTWHGSTKTSCRLFPFPQS